MPRAERPGTRVEEETGYIKIDNNIYWLQIISFRWPGLYLLPLLRCPEGPFPESNKGREKFSSDTGITPFFLSTRASCKGADDGSGIHYLRVSR